MRYSAPLAIVATALAAGLTMVAVRVLGPGVEAHPVTRVVAAHLGWAGYMAVSILAIGVGLRILAIFPYAEWGVRTIAMVKVTDATRDAWLVAQHPAIRFEAIGEVLPALVTIVAAAGLALLIVQGLSTPRPRVDPELAV